MDPDLEVPVKLVPLHPLRQCQMWNCQKDRLPYCSLSHQLLAVTEEDKAKAIVIVDGIDITEQERLAQKILAAKCVNEFTGVPRVPAIVLNHHNPWQVEQFESNLVAPESSRDWLYISDNVRPGGMWRFYDTRTVLGNTRTRYNLMPKPEDGSFKLHQYTRGDYNGALFWMSYSGQGLWNQNNNTVLTVVNTSEPDPKVNDGHCPSLGIKEKEKGHKAEKQDYSYQPGVLVKHTRLLERLPELVCRRGFYFQKNPSTDKLTTIPELDWKYFCEEWGGLMENGISALIEVGNNPDQSSSPYVIDLEKHSSLDDNIDVDSRQLILRASPKRLVELFAMLSSGWGMGSMKDLLLVNLRGNDQIIVQAFKEYCEQLGVDACIKMFKSYDGLPGASGSAPLAFLEDFTKGIILSARPLLPVEPFEMEFYYTMVERAAVKAYESASDQAAEVDEISYALMEKVDCLMQNLEREIPDVDIKIGEGCQLLDRDGCCNVPLGHTR
ncbi:unnamed protein product [Arabidopsis halleri]